MYTSTWNSNYFTITSEEPSNIEEEILSLMNDWQFDSLERAYDNLVDDIWDMDFFELVGGGL